MGILQRLFGSGGPPTVLDRVQIIDGPKDVLHQSGVLILIADGTNCVVQLDDGKAATVHIKQLKKV